MLSGVLLTSNFFADGPLSEEQSSRYRRVLYAVHSASSI